MAVRAWFCGRATRTLGLVSPVASAGAGVNVILRGGALAARGPSPTLAGMKASHLILATLVAVAAGCARTSADRAPSRTADEGQRTSQQQPSGQLQATDQPSAAEPTGERPLPAGIVIDPQIREVCQIQLDPQTSVEFDEANPGADPVLSAVTTCLATGPLMDRRVELVDHGNANSTVRAQSVKDYFTGQGIAADKLMTRSAGDSEAHPLAASTPTDLTIERRVDVVLVPLP
jgi:outer membrane protein OmpA-like peptidoglycan-associated protein